MEKAGAGDADAYEAMRQAAMEAKATMLAELGMGETKSNLEQRARAAKRPRASSAKARASSARAAALAEPTRRSRRVAGRAAEAAAGLPKEVSTAGKSTSHERLPPKRGWGARHLALQPCLVPALRSNEMRLAIGDAGTGCMFMSAGRGGGSGRSSSE